MGKIIVLKRRTAVAVLLVIAFLLTQAGFLALKQTAPSLYRMPGTFYQLKTDVKLVALTFDDGPNPNFTPKILDILKQNNVHATFFILGKFADKYPDLLVRIKNEGHEIGNHGFSHDYTQNHLAADLIKTDQTVFTLTGSHTYFYRPPAGRISKQQLNITKQYGHTVTLWSVDSDDWLNPGTNKIVKNVTTRVFPGSVILLHDGGDSHRDQTVDSLQAIIRQLKDLGYDFITVGEMKSMESPTK
jgi:peptidoglycan-N-acetylglucosamine deacetylase